MTKPREHWASKIGFIMAAAGSAIGLGSLWMFPYTVGQNGGGGFILLYLLFTFLIGLPVFLAEITLGRHTQHGAIMAYKSLTSSESNWKMLGWLNVVSCVIILGYYCVVAGWCLSYVLMSLNQFTLNKTPDEIRAVFDTLYHSPEINILWIFLFMLLNIGVVISGVKRGIEHWSKILTPSFIAILLVLFLLSCTMDGFSQAFRFIFSFDFSKITPTSVLTALGTAFFTLSVGLGIILTYGSYMDNKQDIPYMGLIVASMTVIVSLIGSLIIFPVVFSFGFSPEGGEGLVFQTMPILLARLPGTVVLSTIFFALLLFTALTSSISLLEMVVANLMELRNWSRRRSTLVAAALSFIIAIPCGLSGSDALFPTWTQIYGKNFMETMAHLTTSWMMPISGLFTTVFIGWVLEKKIFKDEFMKGSKMSYLFSISYFSIKWLAPVAVVIVILQTAGIIDLNALFSHSVKG